MMRVIRYIFIFFITCSFLFFVYRNYENNTRHRFCGKIVYKEGPVVIYGNIKYNIVVRIESLNKNFSRVVDSEEYFNLKENVCLDLKNGEIDNSYVERFDKSAVILLIFCVLYFIFSFLVFYFNVFKN